MKDWKEDARMTTTMTRNDLVAKELHRELAERLRVEPIFVISRALRNIPKKRSVSTGGARDAIARWEQLLRRRDIKKIREVFLGDDEDSRMMRNSTVFQGVLTQRERDQILADLKRAA